MLINVRIIPQNLINNFEICGFHSRFHICSLWSAWETTHVNSVLQFPPNTLQHVLGNGLQCGCDFLLKFPQVCWKMGDTLHSLHIAPKKKIAGHKEIEKNRKLNIFEVGNEIHISLNFSFKFGRIILILFSNLDHIVSVVFTSQVMEIFMKHPVYANYA